MAETNIALSQNNELTEPVAIANSKSLPAHRLMNKKQILLHFPKGASRKISFVDYLSLCEEYFGYHGYKPGIESGENPCILFNFSADEVIICQSVRDYIPDTDAETESKKILCFKAPGVPGSHECLGIKSSCIERPVLEKFGESNFGLLDMWLKAPNVVVQLKV